MRSARSGQSVLQQGSLGEAPRIDLKARAGRGPTVWRSGMAAPVGLRVGLAAVSAAAGLGELAGPEWLRAKIVPRTPPNQRLQRRATRGDGALGELTWG